MRTKVLLVDDDEMLLAGLMRQLRNKFRVETAISGEVAVKMVEENGPYAVVVSDYMMPGMNGIEFLSQVKLTNPDTIRMMLTGSADMTTAIKAVNEGSIYKFHPKPCPAETLSEAIQSGIDEYQKVTSDQTQLKSFQSHLIKASKLQQMLMPKSDPQVDGYDIAGKSIPCDETGGDYFDFINPHEWGQEKMGIVVADVIGHGISAALLMASVRGYLRARATLSGSTGDIITAVNRLISIDTAETGQFMTLFYLVIEPRNNQIIWVRAGHDPGFLYCPHSDRFEALSGAGLALGVDESWNYDDYNRKVEPGQIVLLTTDGIFEAHNPEGAMFGKSRFKEVVRKNAGLEAEGIRKIVFEAVAEFRGDQPQEDDITLVVLKFS